MPKVIGLDIAKRFFQLHSVDPETAAVEKLKLQRAKLLEHFAKLSPAIIAMEACASHSTGLVASRAWDMRRD